MQNKEIRSSQLFHWGLKEYYQLYTTYVSASQQLYTFFFNWAKTQNHTWFDSPIFSIDFFSLFLCILRKYCSWGKNKNAVGKTKIRMCKKLSYTLFSLYTTPTDHTHLGLPNIQRLKHENKQNYTKNDSYLTWRTHANTLFTRQKTCSTTVLYFTRPKWHT